uniref:EF-hand domain-containing protein n=1 Tax=Arion vulgaris TaxID=1028688 RepID=A0A0B6ZDA5_9EUPU
MPSLTEFQRRKIINLFENFYDTNKDGTIEKADFEETLKKIATLHHWSPSDDSFKREEDRIQKIWAGLQSRADKDGKISKEEWALMWEECVKDIKLGKAFPEWQQEYMEFMFFANDTSDDGFIDRDEYSAIYKLFGFSVDEINFCFDKISEGLPDQKLSKADFENLWREYFTAEDENAKGNYLFGKQKQ